MNKILPIILVIVLSGCASHSKLVFERYSKSIPPLNEITQNSLGETLVLLEDYKVAKGIKIKSEVIVTDLIKGEILVIPADSIAYRYYESEEVICFGPFSSFGRLLCKNKKDESLIIRHCPPIDILGCHNFIGIDETVTNQPEYIISNFPSKDRKNFKQEFIYNGKVDNSIKFIYREFMNDFNRASFIQEVQYDLNESSIIGFKELRIDIIEASNQTIKYKVLKNFISKDHE